ERLNRLEVLLGAWGAGSEQNMQRAEEELFSIQNSRKARIGGLAGLLDPRLMGRKQAEEKRLREFVEAKAKSAAPANEPWVGEAQKAFDVIAKANKERAEIAVPMTLLEQHAAFNSDSFEIARTLLRAAEELPKPN